MKINEHINHPSFFVRFVQAAVDFLICLIIFFCSVYFVFKPVFTPMNNHDSAYYQNVLLRSETLVNSSLYIKENNNYVPLKSDNYEDYKKIVENYYLTDTYFGSEWYLKHGGKRAALSVNEYNINILKIGEKGSLFEFDTTNNEIDKTKVGVLNSSVYEENDKLKPLSHDGKVNITNFFLDAYRSCFNDLFNDPFYKSAVDFINKQDNYLFITSFFVSTAITYLLIPLVNKKHYTVGRLCFKLGIASHTGYQPKLYQIALRYIPCLLLGIIPFINSNAFFVFPIYGCYIFISICTTVILKERTSIPDLVSFTRVCELKSSTIYKDEDEMEREEIGL